jgi:hypothetical protein
MPSPFPGMDPFIEGQRWEDFHHGIISALREALVPGVRPRYVVRVEKRVYLEHTLEQQAEFVRSDVLVLEHEQRQVPSAGGGRTATALADAPIEITLPMPEEHREAFLTIRTRDTMDVVTLIEVLSPTNKRSGSDGRREYLEKREAVLLSSTHLVELDLLRGGRACRPSNRSLRGITLRSFAGNVVAPRQSSIVGRCEIDCPRLKCHCSEAILMYRSICRQLLRRPMTALATTTRSTTAARSSRP